MTSPESPPRTPLAAGWTAGEVARLVGGRVEGEPMSRVTRFASLDDADRASLVFMRSPGFAKRWGACAAPVGIVSERALSAALASAPAPAPRALVVVADADLAMVALLRLAEPPPVLPPAGVHQSSVVAPGARVDPSACVGPLCVIGPGAIVGAGAVLLSQVTLGAGASVGAGCVLHPGVRVLERCVVGDRCTLHAGVVLGADGFGYVPSPDGGGVVKVPHLGHVELESDVEIGANTCVDRAKFGVTRIGRGTKIDNLVQVGHNVVIGRSCIICGNVGLAGSVTLGDGVVLGGGVGIADGVTIGAGAKLAAYSAVSNDVPAGATYMGIPAMPAPQARRMYAAMMRAAKRPSDDSSE